MQSTVKKVLVVLAAALLSNALIGCIKPPTVKLHDIDIAGFDFNKIDLVFDVKVTNPNDFQLDFSDLAYCVTSGQTEIVSGALPSPVMALSGNETTVVRVPVSLEFAGLASLMHNVRAGESIPYEFSSTSKFHFLGLKIPVRMKRKGRLPVLRKPGWRFRKAKFIKGPPSWLELSFEVDNPNVFELPLEQLSGALKYGDDVVLRVNEPNLKPIPPGKTVMFVVRARADGRGVARAIAKALISGQKKSFAFDGRLKMGVPKLLRKMLLEKEPKDE